MTAARSALLRATLTLMAGGALAAYVLAARALARGAAPFRVAGPGPALGLPAFSAVIFAAPLDSALLFRAGSALIGFGGGFFAVGMLTAAMNLERAEHVGLALGAWGAVQATAAGSAVAAGGALRDIVSGLAQQGALGSVLVSPATGYSAVYHLEMLLLFAALIALGPLVGRARRRARQPASPPSTKFGLAEIPG